MPAANTDFEFDAYSRDVAIDPYPYYRTMRDHYPALWCESTRAWALSRYDDVLAALLDPGTFSSAKGNVVNDNPARAGRTLGTTDPPKHEQLRSIVNDAFARRTVGEYEQPMRVLAQRAIEDLLRTDGPVDLRSGLAFPSSAAVLGEVLGVDLTKQTSLADAFVIVLDEPLRLGADPSTDIPERAAAMDEVLGVVRATLEERRRSPGRDVVSSLIEAGLTDEELTWIMFTFLGAGLESSTGQFLLATRSLALHPGGEDPSHQRAQSGAAGVRGTGPLRLRPATIPSYPHQGRRTPRSADALPATPCWCCTAPPTETSDASRERTMSSSTAIRTLTSGSVVVRISVSEPHSLASRRRSSSRRCSPQHPTSSSARSNSTGRSTPASAASSRSRSPCARECPSQEETMTELANVASARRHGIADLLARTALRRPHHRALVWDDGVDTFEELDLLVTRVANSIADRGIGKGDRVVIFAHNSRDYVVYYFALARLGAISVPAKLHAQRRRTRIHRRSF